MLHDCNNSYYIHTTQYNTIQYNTTQYNTIQHNTTQYNTIQHNCLTYIYQLLDIYDTPAILEIPDILSIDNVRICSIADIISLFCFASSLKV